ncbi:hypothetical protein ACSBL2_25735 [Pedobacter sp. AW31-3R]|uniref:hypothetical protein n=1 Tax=Pedobacter sp. AW31-3R TaxID=3445781 RepID=UPI003F9FBB27
MKIILDIRDDKAAFIMEVLKNFKDIKEAKPLSAYKAEVFDGIQEAIHELKLIKQGKLEGIPAKALLNEL